MAVVDLDFTVPIQDLYEAYAIRAQGLRAMDQSKGSVRSYQIGSRSLTRADLMAEMLEIRREIDALNRQGRAVNLAQFKRR